MTEPPPAQLDPPRRSVPSNSTPVKRKQSGSANIPFTTDSHQENPGHSAIKRGAVTEMKGEVFGGMPVEEFFHVYLGSDEDELRKTLDSLPSDLFSKIPSTKSNKSTKPLEVEEPKGDGEEDEIVVLERKLAKALQDKALKIHEVDMYLGVVELIKIHKLCPGVVFTDTSASPDPNSRSGCKWKPDISAYEAGQEPKGNPRFPDFDKVLTAMEIKPASTGPVFSDAPVGSDQEARRKHQFCPSDNSTGMKTLGQILSVMTEICARQYRTHVFMIFFRDPDVRFLRADRAGVIVSEAVDYRANPRGLAEFFLRFSRATASQRGMDATVTLASPQEIRTAKAKLAQWKPDFDRPIVKLDVPNHDGTVRQVLAWGTLSSPESLTGRGTRAIPVWDLEDKVVRFLKDFWRAEHLEKEADILRDLHAKKVQNIPQIVAGGDLYDPNDPSRALHCTITQDFVNADWRTGPVGSLNFSLDARFHHRILEDFIPQSISQCENAKEMVHVIHDAMIAHRDAYEAGVLHRDISSNNVLFIRDGKGVKGILADWDLAMRFKTDDLGNMIYPEAPRQRYRTGTWYFMSALLLQDTRKAHTLQDDLESFFHLTLYLSLHWFPWTGPSVSLANLIDTIYGQYFYNDPTEKELEGTHVGGTNKQLMIEERKFIKQIAFTDNLALTSWIDAWLEALDQFYFHLKPRAPQTSPNKLLLRDHSWVLESAQDSMNRSDWSQLKNPGLQKPGSKRQAKGKRAAPADDDDEDDDSADEGSRKSKRKKGVDPTYVPNASRGASSSGHASGSNTTRVSTRQKTSTTQGK